MTLLTLQIIEEMFQGIREKKYRGRRFLTEGNFWWKEWEIDTTKNLVIAFYGPINSGKMITYQIPVSDLLNILDYFECPLYSALCFAEVPDPGRLEWIIKMEANKQQLLKVIGV